MTETQTESRAGTGPWVARLFATIDTMDADACAAYLAGDALFRFGNSDPVRGRDAIRDALTGFFGAIRGLHHDVVGVWRGEWERGPVVSVESEVTYTRLDGSKTPPLPAMTTLRMEGETIQDYRIFVDLAPLIAAT